MKTRIVRSRSENIISWDVVLYTVVSYEHVRVTTLRLRVRRRAGTYAEIIITRNSV